MKLERRFRLTVCYRTVSFLFGLAGCTSTADAPRGLVDDAGRAIRMATPPQRIVSLSPPVTELLFAIGAGDRVVGRTRFDTYPPEALEVPDVGDAFPPNLEAILALRPDLVVAYHTESNASVFTPLEGASIPVLSIRMDLLESVPRAARWLGEVTGEVTAGDSVALAFETAMADLEVTASPDTLSGMVLVWDNPPMVIGANSFLHELMVRAGGRNVFGHISQPSPTVSIETITAANPDFVLVNGDAAPAFARRPEWRAVRAVRDGRFVLMAGTEFSWPSPRAPEAVRYLREAMDSLRAGNRE